jgi:sugar lactone lactonase YvrE
VARFAGPSGFAFDSLGNAFVVDRLGHRIRKIDTNGIVSTFAGSTRGFADGISTNAQFDLPMGLAIDAQNNLYIADWFNLRIRKITPAGEVSTFSGSERGFRDGDRLQALYEGPVDMTIDRAGNLYAADWANNALRKIDTNGIVSTFVQGLSYVERVTADQDRSLYAYSGGENSLNRFGPGGDLIWKIATPFDYKDGPIGEALLGRVGKVHVLPRGNLLVANEHRLRLITVGAPSLLAVGPAGGEFTNSVEVTLSCTVPDGVIRYSIDGTSPSPESGIYRGPLEVTNHTTLLAQVFVNDFPVSNVSTAIFTRIFGWDPGISPEWRARYFGPEYRTDPRADAKADPDSDGAINIHEFVAGTDPLDPASRLQVSTRLVPVITWTSITNKAYRVLRRDSIHSTNTIALTPFIRAISPISTHVDFEAQYPHSFYFIEVQPELEPTENQ